MSGAPELDRPRLLIAAVASACVQMPVGAVLALALTRAMAAPLHGTPILVVAALAAGPVAGLAVRLAGMHGLLARLVPVVAALVVGAVAGLLAGAPLAVALAAAGTAALDGVVATAVARALARRVPDLRPALAGPRRALWALAGLLLLAQLARASAFMIDPAFVAGAMVPQHRAHHLCLAAYLHAAELARAGEAEGIYDPARFAAGSPTRIDGLARYMGDQYQYPPTFLILPAAGLALTNDALVLRAGWYALQIVLFGALALWIALWIGSPLAVLLLAPFLASLPVLVNFQIGQAHLLVIAASVAAAVAFADRRDVLGGALLAAAIGAKIFPGVLVISLAVQRRWRAIGMTAAAGMVLLAITWLALGSEPIEMFVRKQLGSLATGQAFDKYTDGADFSIGNLGSGGILAKLGVLLNVDLTAGERAVSLLLVAGVLALAIVRSRAVLSHPAPALALVMLTFCTTRYAPIEYAMAAPVWLLALEAARRQPGSRAAWLWAAVWLFLQSVPFLRVMPVLWRLDWALAGAGLIAQLLILGLGVRALVSSPTGKNA